MDYQASWERLERQLVEMSNDNQPKGLFRKSDGKLHQGNIEHETKIRQQVIDYVLALMDSAKGE